MPLHRLILEKGPPGAEWVLEWNDSTLSLTAPDGTCVLKAETAHCHHLFEVYELYAEHKISFQSPDGPLTFKPQQDAYRDAKELVAGALRSDHEYRETLQAQARSAIPRGLVMFVVGMSFFGLYCWWASWAPDPPRGHWLYWVGWLIHLGLLVLLAMALAGPYLCFLGWRQLRQIGHVEREVTGDKIDLTQP